MLVQKQHVPSFFLGAVIVMKDISFLSILPELRPGKIMRRLIKALLTKKEMGDLYTI